MAHRSSHNDIEMGLIVSAIGLEASGGLEPRAQTMLLDMLAEEVYELMEQGKDGARTLLGMIAEREIEAQGAEKIESAADWASRIVCQNAGIVWADEYPAALIKACERDRESRDEGLSQEEYGLDEEPEER